MIVFASSITDPELYRSCAEPGIRLAAEPDSEVIANAAAGSIFRSYNLIMDSVAEREDLEALVLLHQDSELASPDFCATLRQRAQRPRRRRRRLRRRGRGAQHRLVGGLGDLGLLHPPVPRARRRRAAGAVVGDRQAACLRADRRGRHPRRVRARALAVGRAQRPLRRVAGPAARLRLRLLPAGARRRPQGRHRGLQASSTTTRSSWSATPRPGSRRTCASPRSGRAGCARRRPTAADWHQRARRAEAEASLARTQAVAAMLHADAEKIRLQRELAEVTESTSWRVTKPLRRLNAARRARQAR